MAYSGMVSRERGSAKVGMSDQTGGGKAFVNITGVKKDELFI
jgi:hypothetical protein